MTSKVWTRVLYSGICMWERKYNNTEIIFEPVTMPKRLRISKCAASWYFTGTGTKRKLQNVFTAMDCFNENYLLIRRLILQLSTRQESPLNSWKTRSSAYFFDIGHAFIVCVSSELKRCTGIGNNIRTCNYKTNPDYDTERDLFSLGTSLEEEDCCMQW